MELEHAIRHRRSVRHFTDTPVPAQDVRALIDAAAWAPSGGNEQPWRVTAIAPDAAHEVLARHEARAWHALAPKVWSLVERARKETLAPEVALPAAAAMVEREGRSRGRPWLLLIHAAEPRVPDERITVAHAWLAAHAPALERPTLEDIRAVQGPIQDGVTHASALLFTYNLALLAHARGLGACINHSLLLARTELERLPGVDASAPVVSTLLLGHPDVHSEAQREAHARAQRRPVAVSVVEKIAG